MPVNREKLRNDAVTNIVYDKPSIGVFSIGMSLESYIALAHDVGSSVDIVRLDHFWVLKIHLRDGDPMLSPK